MLAAIFEKDVEEMCKILWQNSMNLFNKGNEFEISEEIS